MLNAKLQNIHNDIDNYFLENSYFLPSSSEEINLVLDIEVCPNKEKNEAITYSIALMSCDNDKDLCYKFIDVETTLKMLLNLDTKKVNIYVHNLFYDIKPFLVKFIELYGNNPIQEDYYNKQVYDIFNKKKEKIKVLRDKPFFNNNSKYTYNLCLKKGQLYGATFFGENINRKNREFPIELNFKDTYKIVPYSLQKCCSAFLDLELGKDGLDYDKVRNVNDELTKEEKVYIYNDVFGLSYLVKKLIINGFDLNGKHVQYTKITNSSQSLYDYKKTLMEDFIEKKNAFSNVEFGDEIECRLMKTEFYSLDEKSYNKSLDILFKCVFPPSNYFEDSWIRHSYYGGLATVDFKNVNKYSKFKNKIGQVFDVNSLYPFIMLKRLLPYGQPSYSSRPYENMKETYKEQNPLYIQEITIYDMKLKKGKMSFVQVKDNIDFNGREVIEENVNKHGEKVPIKLILCNPLLELLFENYDVKSYKLGCHLAYRGSYNLFENYLSYWGEIKKKEKGANREIAKLRQNALYGKFGTSGDNEITTININNGKFEVNHTHEEYVTDNIYIAMSSFITSYAKKYLVEGINNNRDRFLYCDTDSLHLFGEIEEVKGLKIGAKNYGEWKHELTFNDFKYIGAKRYAEKNIENGEWDIKCCGLSDKIMKQVNDINVFENCEYSSKQLNNIKLYTNDSIYYYKDKNCTKKVKGLIKSKKAKIVKNGTLIIEQPYMITSNNFYM